MKLHLLLAKWLRKREEGQDPAITRYSQGHEAFFRQRAYCQPQPKGPQQTALWMQLVFHPSAGAEDRVLLPQRQVRGSPAPLGEPEEICILTCAKQTCSLPKPHLGAPQRCGPAWYSVHSRPIKLDGSSSDLHLGCTSVCSTAWLPAKEVQRKLFEPLL